MKQLLPIFARKAPNAPDVIALPAPDAPAPLEAPAPKRPIRKRVAVLLAAIAVPAMAAPGDFGRLPADAPTEAEIVSQRLSAAIAANPPMDFERPGMSFPGSAFYFLADPPSDALIALPTLDAYNPGAEGGRSLGQAIDAGPAAQPFFAAGGIGHERALECLAQAVWYEAASESESGQRAVAQVVLNRVTHPSWPASVCGVVYQGSNRSTGCQFTFTCDGSLARRPGGSSWTAARRIASDALAGEVYAPIGHATHYHTLWVSPFWAASLDHVGTIGAHRFYRNRGAGGESAAFTERYAGYEPGVSERAAPVRSATRAPTIAPDVSGLDTRPSSSRPLPPLPSASTPVAPGPILADPSLSGAGQVREDYAQVGQWKSDAARAALQTDEQALASEAAQAPRNTP